MHQAPGEDCELSQSCFFELYCHWFRWLADVGSWREANAQASAPDQSYWTGESSAYVHLIFVSHARTWELDVHVCIYVCMYVCMHVYMQRTRAHTFLPMLISVCIYMYMQHVHLSLLIFLCVCVCVCKIPFISLCVLVHTCVCAYMYLCASMSHARTHANTHTRIRTHTHTPSLWDDTQTNVYMALTDEDWTCGAARKVVRRLPAVQVRCSRQADFNRPCSRTRQGAVHPEFTLLNIHV